MIRPVNMEHAGNRGVEFDHDTICTGSGLEYRDQRSGVLEAAADLDYSVAYFHFDFSSSSAMRVSVTTASYQSSSTSSLYKIVSRA